MKTVGRVCTVVEEQAVLPWCEAECSLDRLGLN